MKTLFTAIFLICFLSGAVYAQAPEKINYQAVVRNTTGQVLQNQTIGLRVSILQGSDTGPAVFAETHTPTTNSYGLVSVQIGTGSNLGPQLNTIDWSAGIYFIAIQIDPNGGTSYSILSTSQLVSVPYALHAKTVEENDDADADPTNEYNSTADLTGTTLNITDAGSTLSVDLAPLVDDADANPTNEAQSISKVGSIITLSSVGGVGGGAITDDVNDADASPTNELNTGFNLVGTTLSVTDAGGTQSVNLSGIAGDPSTTNELNTSANLSGTTLNIIDAGGTLSVNLASLVNDADASITNELNTGANLTGTTLNIIDAGGTIAVNLSSLVNDADASTTNELNTGANLSGTTLNIIDAGGTLSVNLSSLVNDADASTTNELNSSAVLSGNNLQITDAGGTITVDLTPVADDADADPANEIQTLTLVGSDLSISGGNTITLGGGTDSQILSVVGSDLTISNGNTVTIPSAVDTDDQTLSVVGNDLTIADGNTVALPLQTLSVVGSDLTISGGNTVTLPGGGTDSQTLSIVGTDISISNGNTISIPANTDAQTLSIVGTDLTISGGNTVTLPGGADTDDQTLSLVGADLTIADGNTVTLPLQTHFVGEVFGGGIIVFVDSTGQHGLIAALTDAGGAVIYETGANSTTEFGTSLYDGEVNTNAMIAGLPGEFLAAEAAAAYSSGGFTDWYLPSVYELEILFHSGYVLQQYALPISVYYWSSTEVPGSFGVQAYKVTNNSILNQSQISGTAGVRCVRKF